MNRFAPHLVLGGALLCCAPAYAQDGDDANRAAARELGTEGIEAYDRGDDATAIEKLDRAFQVVKVPTLGLWLARALARSGKLVEAAERYREVTRLDATTGSVATQKEAQAAAERELARLVPRIPSLDISLVGASPSEVEVAIDDVIVPATFVGEPRPVNPGTRTVTAKHGTQRVTERVSVAEGQRRAVVLRLPSNAEAVEAASPAGGSAANTPDPTTDHARTGRPTVAWMALGVGAAGLVAGGVTGGLAIATRASVADHCDGNDCREPAFAEVDRYNALRSAATVGFVVGGLGLAAGGGLLLLGTKTHGQESSGQRGRGLMAQIGVGTVRVIGSF